MKKINRTTIIIGLMALVLILGLITTLLTRSSGVSDPSSESTPLPTPAQYSSVSTAEIATRFQRAMQQLPQEDRLSMQQFITTLPHLSPDLDVVYDRQLDVVLVSFKTERGPDVLEQLLTAHGVLEIYSSGSRSFITSTKSINELSNMLKNPETYDPEDDAHVAPQRPPTGP